jgi:hypothetical protein
VQEQGRTGIKNGALLPRPRAVGLTSSWLLTKTFAINRIWPVAGWRSWNAGRITGPLWQSISPPSARPRKRSKPGSIRRWNLIATLFKILTDPETSPLA